MSSPPVDTPPGGGTFQYTSPTDRVLGGIGGAADALGSGSGTYPYGAGSGTHPLGSGSGTYAYGALNIPPPPSSPAIQSGSGGSLEQLIQMLLSQYGGQGGGLRGY